MGRGHMGGVAKAMGVATHKHGREGEGAGLRVVPQWLLGLAVPECWGRR